MTTPYVDTGIGYVRQIQATIVNAVRNVFGDDYQNPKFRNVRCSIEYPVDEQDYPGIWVQYDDAMLQVAGIAYTEIHEGQVFSRWRFQGYAEFVVVALSSLERDTLYDELVSQIAFSAQTQQPSDFRTYIEADQLIATIWSWDTVEARGKAASPGTPWGSEEIMYERSFALQVVGEFVTSPDNPLVLVNLSEITVTATQEGVQDPESLIVVVDSNFSSDPAAGTLPPNFPGSGAFGG